MSDSKKNWTGKAKIAFLMSFAGGLIILAGGLALFVAKTSAFSPLVPSYLHPILGAGYSAMESQGWGNGFPYVLGVTSGIVGGIPVMYASFMTYKQPSSKSSRWGYVIIVFSLVSLIGLGGFLVGAILGELGGAFEVLRKRSVPKVVASPPPIPVAR
jgi:hypothetical protein